VDPYSRSQTRSSQLINENIIKNVINFSKNNATIIYFSTIRVFSNNIVPNTSNFGVKSSFEKEKIHLEKLLLSESKKNNKRAFIFRMSQVFGENQPRTHYFRDNFSKEKVIVQVSPDKISNIVHTVTIKDAIIKCLDPNSQPGVYSLVNNPQWTWKNVIDYYKKPETTIEYKPEIDIEYKVETSTQNSFFWNILKSNKKLIKPFLYYVSPKFEPQIQKKLAEKKMINAINNILKSKSMSSDEDLQYLRIKKYQNIKTHFTHLVNNYDNNLKLPEEITKDFVKENLFSIEEFNFNPIPGPFFNGLNNTKRLLDDYSQDIF
jgi:hypothetical protein